MTRLKHYFEIPSKYSNENIKKLLEKNVCKRICNITSDALKNKKQEQVKKQVDDYYKKTHSGDSSKYQCGKVWLLVKKQKGEDALEVLRVGY